MKTAINKYVAIVFTSLTLTLQGCGQAIDAEQNNEVDIIRPAKTALVESAGSNGIRRFPATVEPSKYARMAFRLNGEVAEVNVVAGQKVKKGEVLVRLDDTDLKVQLAQATAKFKLAKSQQSRVEKLLKDKLISSSEAEQIEAEFEIAQAQLQIAQNNLEYSKLKAPFDGVVAVLHVESFESIVAKQPILEVQGRDFIDVTIAVPEQLMIRLPKGDRADNYQPTIIFDTAENHRFKVTLKEHDISPNPATKSYRVVFTLATPTEINVLPGMTGTLEVELDKLLRADNSLLKVPNSALFIPNGMSERALSPKNSFLYRLDEDMRVNLVAVEIVEIHQSGAVVRVIKDNELGVGDEIIAAGPHLLAQGAKVQRWRQERGL